MNIFIIIEIRKPRVPNNKIPIAETLAIVEYSFFEGFFKMCQTLLHFSKNDFVGAYIFLMKKKSVGGL